MIASDHTFASYRKPLDTGVSINGLGGLFAFFDFRAVAKKQASEEATRVAEAVAERTANDYLQRELPDVVKAYREIMDFDGVADEIADQLARAQEDPKGGASE